jgi:alanine-glyoxylate transaminase/serine-glyoxylate transaminase/serine-pyruvate transaminase
MQKSNQQLLDGVEEVLLMGPGPSMVHESVYKALSVSTLGHLDPYFIQIMDMVKLQLQQVFQTGNRLTIPMSGTGSAGMETSFVNFIEPGDPVLILINGVFGMRQKEVAERLGARVDTMEYAWGTPVLADEVSEKLTENNYKIVAMVHAETSTGVANPVQAVGELVRGTDSLFLVDTVTSLGGMEVAADKWGIDIIYSGTQKCLSCPPGLAPVSVSERAVEILRNRVTKVPNWYLDLNLIINYWEGQKRAYHHTAPINMIYALHQSLFNLLEEGLENAWSRHLKYHKVLVSGLEELGLTMFVDPDHQLPMLNTVVVPDGVDETSVRSRLRKDYRIEIGAGLGPMAGKVWRIGLMGETCRAENIDRVLSALKEIL